MPEASFEVESASPADAPAQPARPWKLWVAVGVAVGLISAIGVVLGHRISQSKNAAAKDGHNAVDTESKKPSQIRVDVPCASKPEVYVKVLGDYGKCMRQTFIKEGESKDDISVGAGTARCALDLASNCGLNHEELDKFHDALQPMKDFFSGWSTSPSFSKCTKKEVATRQAAFSFCMARGTAYSTTHNIVTLIDEVKQFNATQAKWKQEQAKKKDEEKDPNANNAVVDRYGPLVGKFLDAADLMLCEVHHCLTVEARLWCMDGDARTKMNYAALGLKELAGRAEACPDPYEAHIVHQEA